MQKDPLTKRRQDIEKKIRKVKGALLACTDNRKVATPSEWWRLSEQVDELLDTLSDLLLHRDILDGS